MAPPKVLSPMLSAGFSKVVLPSAALVTDERVPVRRSPRTTVTVYVSCTLRLGELKPEITPACISGMGMALVPTGR